MLFGQHMICLGYMGKGVTILLIVIGLVTISVFSFYYSHYASRRSEIQQFVNGPYSGWLLYERACTIGNIRDEIPIDSLQKEIDYCNRLASGGQAGYYVYDFNIRRSLYIDTSLMNILMQHNILSFPSSLYGPVESGTGNEFNTIVPVNDFTDFDISCKESVGSLDCTVDSEIHPIAHPEEGLDLLVPKGIVQGADWYKLLKPRFFSL